MPTLKQFRYLDAVARHGHFGRAADACAVTQPALSMQIKALEDELGLALVERRSTGARITESGVDTVRRARDILASVQDLTDHARQTQGTLTGPLRLGVIPSIAPYLLPQLLADVARLYPSAELLISETQTERLLDQLLDGALDLLLLALPIDHPGVETRTLYNDPFILALPTALADATANQSPLEILDEQRLLLLEDGHCLRDQALAVCRHSTPGLDPFGASTLTTIVQMVAAGMGVTLLPEMSLAVETSRADIALRRFGLNPPARTIGLAWRTSSPRARDFEALGALLTAPSLAPSHGSIAPT